MGLDVQVLKKDFPTLAREVHGRPLVFLDSAASSQTPRPVLEAMADYYEQRRCNIERGVYLIATEATDDYEAARTKVAGLVGGEARGCVFTRGTTESINLVAYSWVRERLGPDDALLTTEMEHHANLVPWLRARESIGFDLRAARVDDDGRIDLDDVDRLLADGRVRFVALSHQSNVLGTVNPVREIAERARAANPECRVLVDGAQSVPHLPVSLDDLGADFLAFSAHKMCGPTGVGALVARPELLDDMPPFLTGGAMIRDVTLEGATWNEIPYRFEAGTMPIAEAIGFGAAVDYLQAIGFAALREHEEGIVRYALDAFADVPDITLQGPLDAEDRGATFSFVMDGVHAHDVGTIVDREGVCIRVGHHCTKPLMRKLGVAATARASTYLYNDTDDIDALIASLDRVRSFFGPVPESTISTSPPRSETDPQGPGGPA